MTADSLIRLATPDDAAAVSAVLAASYPPLLASAYDADLLRRALPLMIKANPKLLSSGSYYVAMAGDEVVGCGGWTPEQPGTGQVTPGVGHIRHFAVRADQAGCGVGRALYQRCEKQARDSGISTFESQATLNGEPFYAALGFHVIGRIEVPMSNDVKFPSILMRRTI